MPTLHVLLGGGGVGKTTLAAGYALALARAGRRVGLLGIDPSRRLHDALGLELDDLEADVPHAGLLKAAILQPHQAVLRWAAQDCKAPGELETLERNPFFLALTDRLASATDALAAVRIAEWVERDPQLTDLVVDTSPGVAAIGFLHYPRDIEALLTSPLVGWFRTAARVTGGGAALRFGARQVLAGLGRVAGKGMIGELAHFFALMGAPLQRMVARLERAQAWLSGDSAELLLVTSPRDAAATGARQLSMAMFEQGLKPKAAIVNRTWAPQIETELASLTPELLGPGSAATLAYAQAYARAQASATAAAATLAPIVVTVPAAPGLYAAERREVLIELGETLRLALMRPAGEPQSHRAA